jgi:hypothetical protein
MARGITIRVTEESFALIQALCRKERRRTSEVTRILVETALGVRPRQAPLFDDDVVCSDRPRLRIIPGGRSQ